MTYSKSNIGLHAMSAANALSQSVPGHRGGYTVSSAAVPTGRLSLSSQRDYSDLLGALSCEPLQTRSTLGSVLCAFMSPVGCIYSCIY